MIRFWKAARWVPFVVVGLASLWASAQTTQGYREPEFDWNLSPWAIANALTKMPHIASTLMLFLLGALAVGPRRLWLAAALTLLIGIGWELVQMPTVGNHPRIADLAPDLVGIAIGWSIVALGLAIWRRRASRG